MAVVFSTPSWALVPSFCCGFIARVGSRSADGLGASQNLATFLAAALVLFIAVRFVRRPGVSPIVMVAGVIPLGAAGVLLRAIVGFLQVLSLKGEGLSAPVALIPIQAFCLRRRARLLWERGLDISLGNPLAGIRPSNLTGTLKS
jgi:hypothetical protein